MVGDGHLRNLTYMRHQLFRLDQDLDFFFFYFSFYSILFYFFFSKDGFPWPRIPTKENVKEDGKRTVAMIEFFVRRNWSH